MTITRPPHGGAGLTCLPANLLGRYLVGELVTHNDMMTDTSPWVAYWLPDHHGRRIHWLLTHDTNGQPIQPLDRPSTCACACDYCTRGDHCDTATCANG